MELQLKTRSDTDALIDSLGGSSPFSYIDIQKHAALQQALKRWPLLAKLRQEWTEVATDMSV
jgi:hypothetical protein